MRLLFLIISCRRCVADKKTRVVLLALSASFIWSFVLKFGHTRPISLTGFGSSVRSESILRDVFAATHYCVPKTKRRMTRVS